MVCGNLKITVYFVTGVHRSTLSIHITTLQHKNINEQKDRGAFDFQNIKRVEQSFFYILTVFIL